MAELNRIETRFQKLRQEGRKAFIAFTTAGFPNLAAYPQLLEKLPEAGVDLIEIGVPFSDPMADGPAIQAANNQALREGITLAKILDMVRYFRTKDNETPIVLMGYYNPIYSYGMMRFLDDAQKAGVDGFIVPDLPPEEDEEFRVPAKARGLNVIRLVTPTTDKTRLPTVLKDASGFLYYVSITGITGGASADAANVKEHIDAVRAQTDLPIAIGFGVNTPAQAKEMATLADGVIVGSAIVKRASAHLDDHGKPASGMQADVLTFVSDLANAVHG